MAVIKPTLNLTTNSYTSTSNPGPGSIALSLSVTDLITVDLMYQDLITTSDTSAIFLNGSDLATASGGDSDGDDNMAPGTVGGFIYLKNNSTTAGEDIYIGIVAAGGSQAPTAPTGATDLLEDDHETLRTMTLKPGEFAFFPWDYMSPM